MIMLNTQCLLQTQTQPHKTVGDAPKKGLIYYDKLEQITYTLAF